MLDSTNNHSNSEMKPKERKKISLKIKKTKNNEASVEPIEGIWNELRHTQSTIAYIKSLIDEKSEQKSKYKSSWIDEINKQKSKLSSLKEQFCTLYCKIRCILQEFDIKKYDRMYLEIMFTKSFESI